MSEQQLLLPFKEYSDEVKAYTIDHVVQFVKNNIRWHHGRYAVWAFVKFAGTYYRASTPHELVNRIVKNLYLDKLK